ncbi:hypothetical protein QR680_015706 [Steinernema hermaphroditum]|uniref:G-protein coupled receptors family 1 profile domain-containing protein n=1 Tax=Steinernema hermaphroditum TaxID=289476 RepID=A0AA39HAL1_9BILA|nr:hypothetical protein QR680_015706 [Steinernema hermaphroditum]
MIPGYFIAVVSVYSIVFCIGFAGNVWLILTLVLIRIDKKQPVTSNFKRMNQYLLSLSVSDLLVLCMIPMLVSYFINGGWKLGFVMCKVFWTVENVNKLLSVAILTIMSVERYMGICKPFNQHIGKQHNIVYLLLTTVVVTFFLCLPIIYYSETMHHDILTENGSVLEVKVSCNSHVPDEILPFFILYMFVFGFVVPVILITGTSVFIVRRVRRNIGSIRRHSPLLSRPNRVIRSISSVVVFHFACWTPFWLAVLLTLTSTAQLADFLTVSPKTLALVRMVTSFLPYINSAGNWIFYAALNRRIQSTSREVRERHERQSVSNNDASAVIIRALSITRSMKKSFRSTSME